MKSPKPRKKYSREQYLRAANELGRKGLTRAAGLARKMAKVRSYQEEMKKRGSTTSSPTSSETQRPATTTWTCRRPETLTNFRAVAARRGWTLGPYSKGKALWSPDRRFVMFDGVQVERNSVEVQWQRPGEDIATPAIERTEAGEQAVLPGAEKISQGEQPNGAPTMASNPRHHKGRPTKIYLATGEARPIWSTWQGRSRAGPAEDDFGSQGRTRSSP
jgi:hypothetical protein